MYFFILSSYFIAMRGAANAVRVSLGPESVNVTGELEAAVFDFQVMIRSLHYITLPHFIKRTFLLWPSSSWLFFKLDSPSKPKESLLKDPQKPWNPVKPKSKVGMCSKEQGSSMALLGPWG